MPKKELTHAELFKKCDPWIGAIYRVEVTKGKGKDRKVEKVEWRVSSDKIPSRFHRDAKGDLKFAGPTAFDALLAFCNFLKRTNRI